MPATIPGRAHRGLPLEAQGAGPPPGVVGGGAVKGAGGPVLRCGLRKVALKIALRADLGLTEVKRGFLSSPGPAGYRQQERVLR